MNSLNPLQVIVKYCTVYKYILDKLKTRVKDQKCTQYAFKSFIYDFQVCDKTTMRKKQVLLLKVGVVVWLCILFVLFIHKPTTPSSSQVGQKSVFGWQDNFCLHAIKRQCIFHIYGHLLMIILSSFVLNYFTHMFFIPSSHCRFNKTYW